MKKQNNYKFEDFTAWQWELAIVASRFELGLLSDSEIIAFTHKLMDKGYYHDSMLNFIETNLAFYQFNLLTDFKRMWHELDLPNLDLQSSEFLNIFNLFQHIIPQPFNFPHLLALSTKGKLYCTFERDYFHKNRPLPYLVYEDLKTIFSLIADLDNYSKQYLSNQISTETLISIYMRLSNYCESWLKQNEEFIYQVTHQLFPQN